MAWYEELFAKEDPARYDIYTESEASQRQVDFIIDALDLDQGARVLDLCCGQGRHLIDLARRGYDVVGLDLSEFMLD
ncbi:MAG: methyltransferase domain-containing protein [Armatimonadetes bacterium]|nr:methyltransferase domain-containing protein [Armatimonadota bacterium]